MSHFFLPARHSELAIFGAGPRNGAWIDPEFRLSQPKQKRRRFCRKSKKVKKQMRKDRAVQHINIVAIESYKAP